MDAPGIFPLGWACLPLAPGRQHSFSLRSFASVVRRIRKRLNRISKLSFAKKEQCMAVAVIWKAVAGRLDAALVPLLNTMLKLEYLLC